MAIRQPRLPWRVRVTPKRSLFSSGLYSLLGASVPIFGALYLLGVPKGAGPAIALVQAIVLAVSIVAWVRYERVFVGVTDAELVERGFGGQLNRTPIDRVHTALIAETYRTNAPDTLPQLLLSDAEGERVLRMRGTFWHESDMQRVCDAVGRPLAQFSEPITKAEFFTSYPQSEYWWDNRRWIVLVGIVFAGLATAASVLALMQLVGIPFWRG